MNNDYNASSLHKREYKVAAIYGSPRCGGNTDELLNRFIEGLQDSERFLTGYNINSSPESLIGVSDDVDNYLKRVKKETASPEEQGNETVNLETTTPKTADLRLNIEKIFVANLKISPCRECRHCSIDGECIVNDEMQLIYPKIMDCDLIVIASPVFFTSVSGQLKVFIDRFQRFWALKYELGKNIISKADRKGILISCAGSKPTDIFDCTKKIARALFDVLFIKYYADFLYNNIDFKGDILKDPDNLKSVYEFAKTGDYI